MGLPASLIGVYLFMRRLHHLILARWFLIRSYHCPFHEIAVFSDNHNQSQHEDPRKITGYNKKNPCAKGQPQTFAGRFASFIRRWLLLILNSGLAMFVGAFAGLVPVSRFHPPRKLPLEERLTRTEEKHSMDEAASGSAPLLDVIVD
jgi:hypothetical protein